MPRRIPQPADPFMTELKALEAAIHQVHRAIKDAPLEGGLSHEDEWDAASEALLAACNAMAATIHQNPDIG